MTTRLFTKTSTSLQRLTLLNNMDHSEGNHSNTTGDSSYPLISTEINIDSVNHSLNFFLVPLSTYEVFPILREKILSQPRLEDNSEENYMLMPL